MIEREREREQCCFWNEMHCVCRIHFFLETRIGIPLCTRKKVQSLICEWRITTCSVYAALIKIRLNALFSVWFQFLCILNKSPLLLCNNIIIIYITACLKRSCSVHFMIILHMMLQKKQKKYNTTNHTSSNLFPLQGKRFLFTKSYLEVLHEELLQSTRYKKIHLLYRQIQYRCFDL